MSLESLSPGSTAILRMERSSGTLLLKAAATEIAARGVRRRLISLQNIENEMSAQELEAWQTVIRVMAHEVMNSLTPVSSLAATAHDLVRDVLEQLPADDPRAAALADARDALEAVARRSEGLLHFVRSHRRLTKPLAAQIEVTPVQRLFARIQRLLASDLADRDIRMTTRVEPETLELAMDAELLDQALINLVRNAIEALRDTPSGHIALLGMPGAGRPDRHLRVRQRPGHRARSAREGLRALLHDQAPGQRHRPHPRAPDRRRPRRQRRCQRDRRVAARRVRLRF